MVCCVLDVGCCRLHLEFTLIFTTNFIGSLDIGASRESFPIEVRSPEIDRPNLLAFDMFRGYFLSNQLQTTDTIGPLGKFHVPHCRAKSGQSPKAV